MGVPSVVNFDKHTISEFGASMQSHSESQNSMQCDSLASATVSEIKLVSKERIHQPASLLYRESGESSLHWIEQSTDTTSHLRFVTAPLVSPPQSLAITCNSDVSYHSYSNHTSKLDSRSRSQHSHHLVHDIHTDT